MCRFFLFIIFYFSCMGSYAEVKITDTNSTGWRLENYVGGNVVAWFTGSECTNGQLTFGVNATTNDKDRFWSLVMGAKIANKPIAVQYEAAAAPKQCIILSFYLKEE